MVYTSGRTWGGQETYYRMAVTNLITFKPGQQIELAGSTLIFVQNRILSLLFIVFTASILQKNALLKWSADCSGIYSFDVEASTDSTTWTTVNVSPIFSDSSATCQYTFTDNALSTGVSYYRLKITDNEKSISYSQVQKLNPDVPPTAVSVFPQPCFRSVASAGKRRNHQCVLVAGNRYVCIQ